jgi:DNA-binding transcriptional LysR family regulator
MANSRQRQGAQTRSEPSWDLYRSFLAVLRTGSLSAAARQLRLTQPTVGRQVAALEAALAGGPLFTRSQRGFLPTPAAIRLRKHVEGMEAAAAALVRDAVATEAERTVARISAPEVLGMEVLPAVLRTFQLREPQVAIELSLSDEVADLLRRDSDLAIRLFRPTQKSIVARKVGEVGLGLYAHRQYLERFGQPRALADLPSHMLVGFDRRPPPRSLQGSLPIALARDLFAFRCDSDPAQLAAIRAGMGIGFCHAGIARRDPDLLPVLPGTFELRLPVWIAMHGDLKRHPRFRALFAAIAEGFARFAATARR